MPDKWEYPWFAAWDLAFHCVTLAHLDPAFAKYQLIMVCREWFQHPNGALPAYEWDFGDVNPPVHAWAALQVFAIDGGRDLDFLSRVFDKLLVNFGWWVNLQDVDGNDVFAGGFLGLDNIGPIDRSHLPDGYVLEQSDATGWMGAFALAMGSIAAILSWSGSRGAQDLVLKFLEHFAGIRNAMDNQGLWDDEDGLFYDRLVGPSGEAVPVKVRSMVGIIPALAAVVIDGDMLRNAMTMNKRFMRFLEREGVGDIAKLADTPPTAMPPQLPTLVRGLVADYLAVGIDPKRSPVFTHSAVAQLNELVLPFLSLISDAELHRNPTVRAETAATGRPPSGLMLTYPAHQAADILFCHANLVPVGLDQLPHIETTRLIARRFNERYGRVFAEPDALLSTTPMLLGVDGHKMSKTRGNGIALSATDDETAAVIRRAPTDSERHITYDPAHRPRVASLLDLLSAVTGHDPRAAAERIGAGGAGQLKVELAEAINETLRPLRARRRDAAADPCQLDRILDDGNRRARDLAADTLRTVNAWPKSAPSTTPHLCRAPPPTSSPTAANPTGPHRSRSTSGSPQASSTTQPPSSPRCSTRPTAATRTTRSLESHWWTATITKSTASTPKRQRAASTSPSSSTSSTCSNTCGKPPGASTTRPIPPPKPGSGTRPPPSSAATPAQSPPASAAVPPDTGSPNPNARPPTPAPTTSPPRPPTWTIPKRCNLVGRSLPASSKAPAATSSRTAST